MQVMTVPTTLKKFRTELYPRVSQEMMAHSSQIAYLTYRKAENGENVSYTTSEKILKALNEYRKLNHPPLAPIEKVQDLELSIV